MIKEKNKKTELETMIYLFEELWIHSDNCSQPIHNIWFPIQEVAKSTQKTRKEVKKHLDMLVSKNLIKRTSEDPLLYKFTKEGKKIKTYSDIQKLLE